MSLSGVQPLLIAKGKSEILLYPKLANRHGLISGATGTGKTRRRPHRRSERYYRIGRGRGL